MEHCHANQSLGRSTRGAASLLPLLQRDDGPCRSRRRERYAAISRRISGWSTATRIKVLAAPLGVRRPCSHCSNVRCETPSIAANCACVSPALRRACAMGERGSTEVRLPRPALSSRTPSSTSCQMSRLASVLARARAVSFLVMFEQPLQSFQNRRRHVILVRLGIERQHPKLVRLVPHVDRKSVV